MYIGYVGRTNEAKFRGIGRTISVKSLYKNKKKDDGYYDDIYIYVRLRALIRNFCTIKEKINISYYNIPV